MDYKFEVPSLTSLCIIPAEQNGANIPNLVMSNVIIESIYEKERLSYAKNNIPPFFTELKDKTRGIWLWSSRSDFSNFSLLMCYNRFVHDNSWCYCPNVHPNNYKTLGLPGRNVKDIMTLENQVIITNFYI